jgi:isopentenyl phosphate kinase
MLIFLKLGGSLITDKNEPRKADLEMIRRLANEIARARRELPELKLVLGHGSGSFGHVPGKQYGTRAGVHGPQQWAGFVEVWRQARDLNEIVLAALYQAGLPVIAFPPSAFLTAEGGRCATINVAPLEAALEAGLVPVVNGDVIFDSSLGGTIFSTEDVFVSLAGTLLPDMVLISGSELGVWKDFPLCTEIAPFITPEMFTTMLTNGLGGSVGIDTTGGMLEKVRLMLSLTQEYPALKAVIFSGLPENSIYNALCGKYTGTVITNGTGGE